MPNESITQAMKKYLDSNQAKSIISKVRKRYGIYQASQLVGNVLHNQFGYAKPSFVISGVMPESVERLGFECVDDPCLLSIMDDRHVVDQLIFGHVLSYQDDHMVADFLNVRHLSETQMRTILDQIHQINRCFMTHVKLSIHDQQVVLVQKLERATFADTVVHLFEDQRALQTGRVILDDSKRYYF